MKAQAESFQVFPIPRFPNEVERIILLPPALDVDRNQTIRRGWDDIPGYIGRPIGFEGSLEKRRHVIDELFNGMRAQAVFDIFLGDGSPPAMTENQ
jgi:hypothetical protein